jgi:hypothetical protein
VALTGSVSPDWLTRPHLIVDVKKPNSTPAVIYRFVISPDISNTTAEAIMASLNFTGAVR